jgi:DNA-binding IclR family transcriptional regulator
MSNTRTIGAVEVCFDILETLRMEGSAGISQLAEQLEYSKGTVYYHLRTLEKCGYVQVDDAQYRIDISFLTFGGAARQRELIYHTGSSEADELAEETDSRVTLAIMTRNAVMYIYQSVPDPAPALAIYTGATVPLHCSAAGKAILAEKTEDDVEEILDRIALEEHTEHTITAEKDFLDELAAVQRENVAFNRGECSRDRCSIASSIATDGTVLGALSVTVPASKAGGSWFEEELPNAVRDAARVIEIQSQYSTWENMT